MLHQYCDVFGIAGLLRNGNQKIDLLRGLECFKLKLKALGLLPQTSCCIFNVTDVYIAVIAHTECIARVYTSIIFM